jgi:hypothetical protein
MAFFAMLLASVVANLLQTERLCEQCAGVGSKRVLLQFRYTQSWLVSFSKRTSEPRYLGLYCFEMSEDFSSY